MALKAVVESLDGVAEGLHGEYTQADDGKYYLSVEDVDALPSVRGLTTTLKRFKEVAPDASRLKAKLERLAELEGFAGLELSADEVREKLQALEELEASGKGSDEKVEKLRETYEKQKAALQKQMESKLTEKDSEVQRLSSFVERLTVDNELERALDKVKVIPETREAVKALLKLRGPKVVQDDSGYRGVFETESGAELSVGEYVEAWSTRDEAGPFMPASGNQGSGARTGGGGGSARVNPWAKDTRNLTEQARLVRENPRLAQQLAAEAGVRLRLAEPAA